VQRDVIAESPVATTADVLDVLAEIEKQLGRLGEYHIVSGPVENALAAEDECEDRPTMDELAEREGELHEMRKRVTDLEKQLQESIEHTDKADALQKHVGEAQKEIQDLVGQAEQMQSDLQEKAHALEEAAGSIEGLASRIAELEQAQAPPKEVEKPVDAAAAEVPAGKELMDRQRRQIERLTEQLVSLQADAEPREIQERDDRIAELEDELQSKSEQGGKVGKLVAGFGDALSKVRSKSGKKGVDEGASSALEFRLREVTTERDDLREEVKQARQEAHELRREIDAGQTPGGAPDSGQGDSGGQDNALIVSALRARVTQLEDELEAVSEGDEQGHATVLQQRISRLEQELALARTADKQGELHAQQAKELREQWKQLREDRAALGEGATATPPVARPWQRALVIFSCLVGLAVVAAAASAMAANRFLPATVAASVTLDARSRNGEAIKDPLAVEWDTWHRETLGADEFLSTVARRLADQLLTGFGDQQQVAARLRKDLAIDSAKQGSLTLTLAGTDAEALTALLDTVATTLARESSRHFGSRRDAVIAVVGGERQEAGRVRHASINATPISDHRVQAGVVFFVVGTAIGLVLIKRIRGGLIAAKAALSEDDSAIVAGEQF